MRGRRKRRKRRERRRWKEPGKGVEMETMVEGNSEKKSMLFWGKV